MPLIHSAQTMRHSERKELIAAIQRVFINTWNWTNTITENGDEHLTREIQCDPNIDLRR